MCEYRLPWLLAGIACALLAVCVLVLVVIAAVSEHTCTEEMAEQIGKFDSKEAAIRAAIPKMAAAVTRCPDAKVYRVMWVEPEDQLRHAVLYERWSNRIGYEDDCFSSFSEETSVVDDAAIRVVADRGGTLADFAQYDQKR